MKKLLLMLFFFSFAFIACDKEQIEPKDGSIITEMGITIDPMGKVDLPNDENFEKGGDPANWEYPDVKIHFAPGPLQWVNYPAQDTAHFVGGAHPTQGTEIDYGKFSTNHPFVFQEFYHPLMSYYDGKLWSYLQPSQNDLNTPDQNGNIVHWAQLSIRHGEYLYGQEWTYPKIRIEGFEDVSDDTDFMLTWRMFDAATGVPIGIWRKVTPARRAEWESIGFQGLIPQGAAPHPDCDDPAIYYWNLVAFYLWVAPKGGYIPPFPE